MKISNQHIIPSLFFILIILIIGLWIGLGNNIRITPEPNYLSATDPGTPVTPIPIRSCQDKLHPVAAGGVVYFGETCLNVSDGVSSGQAISWYKNGRKSENDHSDAVRSVRDAHNFSITRENFMNYEGNWYVGTTDRVAFVVRDAIPDRSTGEKNSTNPGSSGQDTDTQISPPVVFNESGKFDAGVWAIMNSSNRIDSSRVWVVLEEQPGILREPGTNLTLGEKAVFREQQRAYYLNLTKPVVDYVRGEGYTVDYIGQTTPAIEVLAPPPFMEELAKQPTVRKVIVPKTTHPLIKEMLQRQPDETLKVMVGYTKPPGVIRMPSGSFTEEQLNEYYSANRPLFENHTRPIHDLLENENIRIEYADPYSAIGFRADVPVYLIEEFNARPEITYVDRVIPAYII